MVQKTDLPRIQIYCPNCGTLNIGHPLDNGEHHFRCEKCRVMMVRSHRSRRHNTIELIIPKSIKLEDR